jgi:hypothetical protein
MHAPLRAFWELFATAESEVAGGVGLSSRPTPLIFANGVWDPDPERLDEAAAWCAAQRLPPAAFVGVDHPLPETHTVERLLVASSIASETENGRPAASVVEQVGWTHTRPLAELFAYRYDRMDIEEELVRTVAGAMQRNKALEAYLAFDAAGEPAGAALALTVDPVVPNIDSPRGSNDLQNPDTLSSGLVLIWAEGLRDHDPALAVASRFPELAPWRLTTNDPGRRPIDAPQVTVARVALAP